MITIGIDSGSQNTKGVLIKDGIVLVKVKALTEFNAKKSAEK